MTTIVGRVAATALLSAAILFATQSCSVFNNGPQGQPGAQATQPATAAPAASVPASPPGAAPASAPAAPIQVQQAAPQPQGIQNFTMAVRQVTEKVRPAVVQITSS